MRIREEVALKLPNQTGHWLCVFENTVCIHLPHYFWATPIITTGNYIYPRSKWRCKTISCISLTLPRQGYLRYKYWSLKKVWGLDTTIIGPIELLISSCTTCLLLKVFLLPKFPNVRRQVYLIDLTVKSYLKLNPRTRHLFPAKEKSKSVTEFQKVIMRSSWWYFLPKKV